MAKDKTPDVTEEITPLPADQQQGEVKVDKKASADVLGGGTPSPEADADASAQNIEDAKRDALRNHADAQA